MSRLFSIIPLLHSPLQIAPPNRPSKSFHYFADPLYSSIHPLIHSFTHSLFHSFTHSLIHSFTPLNPHTQSPHSLPTLTPHTHYPHSLPTLTPHTHLFRCALTILTNTQYGRILSNQHIYMGDTKEARHLCKRDTQVVQCNFPFPRSHRSHSDFHLPFPDFPRWMTAKR